MIMDTKWMDNIHATQEEMSHIQSWCEEIGYFRYEKLYLITKEAYEEVTYENLTECAKYDARLSAVLFKSIKYIESYLCAILSNKYGEKKMRKDSYKNDLMEILDYQRGDKCPNLSIIRYDIKHKRECTLAEFLDNARLSTIIHTFLMLPQSFINTFEVFSYDKASLKTNLEAIRKLRNSISHNELVVNRYSKKCIIRGITCSDLNSNVINVLRHMPNKEMVKRRIKEINDISSYVKKIDGEDKRKEIPDRIAIKLQENEVLT